MNLICRIQRAKILISSSLFLLSFLVYLKTLAPSVVTIFDDSLEFQLVTYQLGIAHPTGYPLYTLVGKLFTFIPLGNVAFRVNLMSAFFGAATVALLYLLIVYMAQSPASHKQTKAKHWGFWRTYIQAGKLSAAWPHHLGGIIGALLLAGGQVFWQQATIAEVYSLNAFFVAALLLLTLQQDKFIQPASSAQLSGDKQVILTSKRGICMLAVLAGLSLTHHRTAGLVLPASAVYLLLIYGKTLFKPKIILLSILFFLLPLLLYLYLPLRGHIGSLDGNYQNTWPGFWQQISASAYGLSFILDNPFGHERDFTFYRQLLSNQFISLIPGFMGLIYLFGFGQRKYLTLTGLAFLTYLPFNMIYNVTDIEVFFIPIFIIWAVWSGLGATFIFRLIATQGKAKSSEKGEAVKYKSWGIILSGFVFIIFAFIIFRLGQTSYTSVSQQYSWQVHDYGLDILQQPFPTEKKAAIVGILGEMTLLRYFQQTENRRPDIETVTADLEADRFANVERLLAEGKNVYLTRELPGAAERWSLEAVGPLIHINPEPITNPPAGIIELKQNITPEIMLLGYSITYVPHTGDAFAPLRLTLFWQVEAPIEVDLKVSARLLDSAGETRAVVDAVPVHFAYPTSKWRTGEIVADVYDLSFTIAPKPGQYTPLIIWYNPTQNAAEVGRVELEPLTIE